MSPAKLARVSVITERLLKVKFKVRASPMSLDMTVEDAQEFFSGGPVLSGPRWTRWCVGLGLYKSRPAGDDPVRRRGAARQLSKELARSVHGPARYISLNEPTTGPAFRRRWRNCWKCCTSWWMQGNSSSWIEHNLDVIKTADHLNRYGPEGGDGVAGIVAEGTPEEVAEVRREHTGRYLKPSCSPSGSLAE